MDYADGVHQVLLRKISKAEQDLMQLKLDYCRFIFGLTHRSLVNAKGQVWQVQSVDVDSMVREENGGFSRPGLMGVPQGSMPDARPVPLGNDWMVVAENSFQPGG
ncbi:hypothetical protein RE428_24870 [Marinobacter nanhaiticus D15-8W]|uniref:Uncharacterized protein n=1 Tax=Marinobacter nanhaiticus D15-8W TaxID=626887 RepID=N6WST2_9GAMM|nr:hypothetical protein [Marinobacter nanhaiticus]ENO14087.1 hypothetical protein J057_21875 [Marinobacter nanhaiticus D15-8W]BES71469.1 hypothetical protein RE428_24870 [Marinobacter nanhaiticus D15-8W]